MPCWNVELVGSIQKAVHHVTFQIKESNSFIKLPIWRHYKTQRSALPGAGTGQHCTAVSKDIVVALTSGKLLIVANTAEVVSKDYKIL